MGSYSILNKWQLLKVFGHVTYLVRVRQGVTFGTGKLP